MLRTLPGLVACVVLSSACPSEDKEAGKNKEAVSGAELVAMAKRESSKSASRGQVLKPSAVRPVKRDWRGLALGSSVGELQSVAKTLGLESECEEGGDKSQITLYDPIGHGWVHQDRIPTKVCRFRNKQRTEEGRGIQYVKVTLVQGKAYSMELEFGEQEPIQGVRENMEKAFGSPSWNGEVTQTSFDFTGEKKVSKYPAWTWEDNSTVVLLYNVIVTVYGKTTETPNVTYWDFSMLPTIRPLQEAAVRGKSPPPAKSSVKF